MEFMTTMEDFDTARDAAVEFVIEMLNDQYTKDDCQNAIDSQTLGYINIAIDLLKNDRRTDAAQVLILAANKILSGLYTMHKYEEN